jgi:hypothetical protein
MESNRYYRNRATPNRLSDLRMGTYERALAQRQMEEAMVLADLTLRAFSRVRTVLILSNVGKVLSGAFMQKRDYVKNGVVHFD